MRIAAKRLRYAIELFVACWGAKIASFADEIAEMQSFLGEVHDCDIWIEGFGKNLRRGQGNVMTNGSDYQTAAWLLSEFVKKRTKEYRSALKLWSEWEANHFAERMRAMI
jgi:CHAD domain-containing protein